jgi:glycine hydroxymethyltransferase
MSCGALPSSAAACHLKQVMEDGPMVVSEMTEMSQLTQFAMHAGQALYRHDPVLHDMLEREYRRQQTTLSLVASCSVTDPSVLACEGSTASNVTAEGYPGARYHAGCDVIDEIERLAIRRARAVFRAEYANVQPLSASIANQIVISKIVAPGEVLLGMDLDAGGHLSHGSRVNMSGSRYTAVPYGLTAAGRIDYEQVERLAETHRPKLIICGTTAFPRTIDFDRFRNIADKVGAVLLADITHIAGLVAAGLHPSPIDAAHITTTCTHKQLYGPRGGLILSGKAACLPVAGRRETLSDLLQKGVFPHMQGAPIVTNIAAKARALGRAGTEEFHSLAGRIVKLADALAKALAKAGVAVLFGGTDNHIVLVNVASSFGLTGIVAQRALESCGIIVNKNRIPGDTKPAATTSGVRLGSNSIAARRLDDAAIAELVTLFCNTLAAVQCIDGSNYTLSPRFIDAARVQVAGICARHPLPGYPVVDDLLERTPVTMPETVAAQYS